MTRRAGPARTMAAVEVERHGGPQMLTPVRRPVPRPGWGQALVLNAWIGVNYVDLQHRAGRPYPVTLPLVPGTEASGLVVEVGEGVDPDLVGCRVVHLGHLQGAYAELTAVDVDHVVALPDEVPLDVAAAVAMAGTTAHALVRLATNVRGAAVVVHAASGSTGSAVVQLARAEGATVVALTSTTQRAEQVRALGVEHVLATCEHREPARLVTAVRELTRGGADIVFDATGRETFDASLGMLAPTGTLVLYGATTGHPPPFSPQGLSGLDGSVGRAGSLALRWVAATDYLLGAARQAAVAAVLDDVTTGRLVVRIDRRYPLHQAGLAHRRLESRSATGKVLLAASEG